MELSSQGERHLAGAPQNWEWLGAEWLLPVSLNKRRMQDLRRKQVSNSLKQFQENSEEKEECGCS